MQFFVLPLLACSSLLGHHDAPAEHASGSQIANFELRDYRGALHQLSNWSDRKFVVVVFLGVDCPLARLYAPVLSELACAFEPRGVAFLAIDSNQQDAITAIARYARQHQLTIPILKDVGNIVADRFGAERTPEAFVLDAQRVMRYRGRIDDQYSVGIHRAKATRRDLAEALNELLAGKPVSNPLTAAPGCLIGRVSRVPAGGAITYSRDIAPILNKHCVVCHRPGQIAPFALTDYEAAAGWSAMIGEVLQQQRMPPWHANPKYGKFANDARLPEPEKQRIFDWIANGCPEGNPADLLPPPVFSEGWSIPTPDTVLSMAEPFTVPAEGTIEYQFFEIDPGFTEDRWIRAAEVRPGNRSVVHHCTVFLKPPGNQDVVEQGTLGSYCLAAMAPGTPPLVLPEGTAKLLPAGWRLVFVMHYTTVGSEQTDQTSIGLVFADPGTVKKEIATKIMMDLDLCIPPHTADHRVEQTWKIKDDVLLFAMFPHMHLRGKSFRYEAIYPDGETQILLDVPRYDFNWQNRYVLAEPKRLHAGSLLRCTALYDNSANNPANPDPNATVHAGLQSWDEMFNGYFDVALAEEDRTKAAGWRGYRPVIVILIVALAGVFLIVRRVAATR